MALKILFQLNILASFINIIIKWFLMCELLFLSV